MARSSSLALLQKHRANPDEAVSTLCPGARKLGADLNLVTLTPLTLKLLHLGFSFTFDFHVLFL